MSTGQDGLLGPSHLRERSRMRTGIDLTGFFCTSRKERLKDRKEPGDAEEDVHARADRREATADRSAHEPGQDGAAGLKGGRACRPDILPVAEGIRGAETGAGQEAEGIAERERTAAAR